jgi:citrate synthase
MLNQVLWLFFLGGFITGQADFLFEVREEQLETGLRGYPVGYCTTSSVDPERGLFYREKPIEELAYLSPERVIYFLLEGKLEEDRAFEVFCEAMQKRSFVHPQVIEYIEKLPRESHPMKLLVAALTILGTFEGVGDYQEDCLNVIAKIPQVVATIINYHAGWGKTPPSDPSLGYMENFVHMLNVSSVRDRELFTELMKLFNILHYDHGGGNLSTFVGKSVASGLEDMYGSLAASMCALAGPRHGKANQDCLSFIEEIVNSIGKEISGDETENVLRKRLAEKKLIYGFGHAVLRKEDPRAIIFFDFAKRHFIDHPLIKTALLLRERGTKVLKENPKIQNPYPNVDCATGVLLSAVGFPFPEYYTLLFGLSRVVGIARQIVYERCEAREGKGTPIVRPKYIYKARSSVG